MIMVSAGKMVQAEIGDHYFGCAIPKGESAAKIEKPCDGIRDEMRKLQRRFRKVAEEMTA
jgi:hypothetical protein